MQCGITFDGHGEISGGQGVHGAFWLAESDPDLIWLCIGEYRGPSELKPFLRYAQARYKQYERDWAYRVYVTDGLKVLGGLNIRYADLFKPEEKRTAEDIIGNISGKLKKLGGKNE